MRVICEIESGVFMSVLRAKIDELPCKQHIREIKNEAFFKNEGYYYLGWVDRVRQSSARLGEWRNPRESW